jgi:phosphate transport system protein
MADELRRSYHDRIAGLHDLTVELVDDAAAMVGNVTAAFVDRDHDAGPAISVSAAEDTRCVADVETEVMDLLAQQAPVARDLRVILAALRIAQVADLCFGLCASLATRIGSGVDVLTPPPRELLREIGAGTASLLAQAGRAWRVIDEGSAAAVVAGAEEHRELQRRFLTGLLDMHPVPMEAAVDLALVARVYERLTDHAVEIANRVVFAAVGAPR